MSYADDRVGMVLDALASSPRADDTIVVVWSDHGFHLGEKLHWHKQTLWEHARRTFPCCCTCPIGTLNGTRLRPCRSRPWTSGRHWPTRPESPLDAGFRGQSLLPAVANPDHADARPPISTWLPGNHSVRRGPWRYIRYRDGQRGAVRPPHRGRRVHQPAPGARTTPRSRPSWRASSRPWPRRRIRSSCRRGGNGDD